MDHKSGAGDFAMIGTKVTSGILPYGPRESAIRRSASTSTIVQCNAKGAIQGIQALTQ